MIISGGEVSGVNTANEAAIRVNGNYYGTVKNYGGLIQGGIVIAGNHSGATSAATTPITEINEGDQSAYISTGVLAKYAELKGGYQVLKGGTAQAHGNHAIYLNDYSKADFISVAGSLSSVANEKSAIYISEHGVVGNNQNTPAIEIKDGGIISSLEGSAIDIDGRINGWIAVHGGTLSTESSNPEHNHAIDFSDANSNLLFIQTQANALTQGKISGSSLANDYMEIHGGTVASEIISAVERLHMYDGRIESTHISDLKHLQVHNGSITSDSLTGLSTLHVGTNASIHIQGNFTAPETTTINISSGLRAPTGSDYC